ncbi:MAG: transcription-repair coupling factor [Candidatus Omnitrophota bacterium]|nr:transcription-repair coupling factor [Candidatus Omnitrophota bacterium]
MFRSLKLYKGGYIDLENLLTTLINFSYKRQNAILEEGDFSRRGNLVDIYPFTFEFPIRIDLDPENRILSIKSFILSEGKALWEHQIVIILPMRKSHQPKHAVFSEDLPLANFVDLNTGDFVVHNQYGIGRFLGFQKVKISDRPEPHLVIEYDRQEKLFVPVDDMHLVQKYISFHARRPKLYRLGSKEWQRVKDNARKGIQKMAWELIALQAMRVSAEGFSYSPDSSWHREFAETFAYKETPDQAKTMQEVRRDMEDKRPMDRLICGDVGYGKTEVAMRAAFKAVMDGKQVAYLVPTTILAEQHYQNFSLRLKKFPMNCQLLCRFKTGLEQKEIVQALAQGRVDIVIGTHRLLSDDVVFKELGLVIIDEEQRFGVKAKEKLKKIRLTTDVLTLSATPIPRTLYMSLMGGRDLSIINTPPENRLPIKTIVVEYDDDLVMQAITRELERKGQVFFIHNRVEDIQKVRERISKRFNRQISLAVAHGQMHARELESVMISFLKGEIQILLCTMIVESGIDVPNANTIIINNAHMFGLSDLHQLRGRVGRFNRPAYAYFLIPRGIFLDGDAQKRLKAISEYAHLGAGFKIAMEDLELRGAGNLLGVQQHGFVEAIGFDLYCRLLRDAVGNLNKIGVSNAKIQP